MVSEATIQARSAAAQPIAHSIHEVKVSINMSLVKVGELISNIGRFRLDQRSRLPLSACMQASEQAAHLAGALSLAYRESVETHRHLAEDKDMLGLKTVAWGDWFDTFKSEDQARIAAETQPDVAVATLRSVA